MPRTSEAAPVIAEQAAHLTVFQRTANYSVPARNIPLTDEARAAFKLLANPFDGEVQSASEMFITPEIRYVREACKQTALNARFLALVAVGLAIWFLPIPAGIDHKAWHLFAIFVATILGLTTAGPAWCDLGLNMTTGVTALSREIYGLHMLILWVCVVIAVGVYAAMIYSIV